MAIQTEKFIDMPSTVKSTAKIVWLVVFAAILSTPIMAQFLGSAPTENHENRALALLPSLPKSGADFNQYSARMDAYLNDHFGFRNQMIEANNEFRYYVLGDINSAQLTRGKDGFIFFNSHIAKEPMAMIDFLCGESTSSKARQIYAKKVASFIEHARSLIPRSKLLLVPTKPIIYRDQLPDWIQTRCNSFTPTVGAVIELLKSQTNVSDIVIYPLDEMLKESHSELIYPKPNFHWDGMGPKAIAEFISEKYFSMPRIVSLGAREASRPSDMQYLLPGVPLQINLQDPDYESAQIKKCDGPGCFPEFSAAAKKLSDVSRYSRTQKKGSKLLIISDSFGHGVAGFFSEYFGEVWHVSTNAVNQLSASELAQIHEEIFNRYQPDEVLFVFHDYSINFFQVFALPMVDGKFPPNAVH